MGWLILKDVEQKQIFRYIQTLLKQTENTHFIDDVY